MSKSPHPDSQKANRAGDRSKEIVGNTPQRSPYGLISTVLSPRAADHQTVPTATRVRAESFDLQIRFRPILSFATALIVAWFSGEMVSTAAVPVVKTPTIGWDGNCLVGRWTPVVVPVTFDEPSSCQLELTAVDPDGNRVVFLSPKIELERGERELTGMIKVGRLDGEIGIRVGDSNEVRIRPGRTEGFREPLKPSTRIIVTVGEPRGFNFDTDAVKQGSLVKVVSVKPEDLPTNPLAFDSVFSLVIAGTIELSAAQAEALREWTSAGGRIAISLPQEASAARHLVQPFVDWLPIKVGEQPVIVREFGGLESYAGKNIRIPQTSTLSIPTLQSDSGETLATSRSDAFLIRAPYGKGAVTLLALDLTSTPLSEWKALTPFCERLVGVDSNVEVREKVIGKGSQLSSTGITDLATQLHATQEHFEQVHRASPWFVMGLLFFLLLVIGPVDYLIVHRLIKKPHFTWISFPLLVAIAAWLASSWSNASNGSSRHANLLDVVSVDVATSAAYGRHFVTLYSPTTSQTAIAVEPLPLAKLSKAGATSRVSWHGIPESSFGGMLRPTGIEQGTRYQQNPDGSLADLPVMQWSSKALVADSVQHVEGLVDCNLRASATGRLTGTITHRFTAPIEDWMVVYKNVVYRHLKKKDDQESISFPPNQVWRVEQPSVYSRELRPYLTGMITMATPRFGEPHLTDISHHQTTYDPLSLDPAYILRIMTFHEDIGGERYTGLTNQILEDEDCSQLHKLGRAVLFGRLRQSVLSIQQDQKTIEPDRQNSFVRLILPVARSTEVIKELRRVVPDQ